MHDAYGSADAALIERYSSRRCWVSPSYLFGPPLDLIITPFEVAAVTISVLIVGFVSMDGGSHWRGGVMLVGVYTMLAIAVYFLPA